MAIIIASINNMPFDEWIDWRKKGIGGSDASVVCGINRWKSPVELWMEKTNQLPYQEAGEAAYWGTQLESLVRSIMVDDEQGYAIGHNLDAVSPFVCRQFYIRDGERSYDWGTYGDERVAVDSYNTRAFVAFNGRRI